MAFLNKAKDTKNTESFRNRKPNYTDDKLFIRSAIISSVDMSIIVPKTLGSCF